MGAEERQPNADLAAGEFETKLAEFEANASRYSFYRLVYLLERLFPASPRMGHTGPAKDERIRIRADPALSFASSDVTELTYTKCADQQQRVRVSSAFLGLYGSVSPMPTFFVETIALSVQQGGPQPVREFLDVLHHRLFALLYRAWSKYRLSVGYLKKGNDAFTRRMFCAVGLDGFAKHNTLMHPFYYLRFAPLLASKSRSARGLQVVLDELLAGIGVEVEQFVGHWTLIEKPLRNKLGVANHQLGEDLVIGKYVFDGGGRFKVKLGPLQYDDYLSFLPGGHRRPFLNSVIDTFTPGIHDVMLELNVDLEAAPRFQLAAPRAATLSRTAWLGGVGAKTFTISVPLEEKGEATGDDDDPDRGEPPPMPY
jgi:type VI secretion system protein ImpH